MAAAQCKGVSGAGQPRTPGQTGPHLCPSPWPHMHKICNFPHLKCESLFYPLTYVLPMKDLNSSGKQSRVRKDWFYAYIASVSTMRPEPLGAVLGLAERPLRAIANSLGPGPRGRAGPHRPQRLWLPRWPASPCNSSATGPRPGPATLSTRHPGHRRTEVGSQPHAAPPTEPKPRQCLGPASPPPAGSLGPTGACRWVAASQHPH